MMTSSLVMLILPVLPMGNPSGPTSGPQVGAALPATRLQAVTGPRAGKEFELPAESTDRPTLIVIVQKGSREVRTFLTTVDWYAAKQGAGSLTTHLVFLEQEGLTPDELQFLAKGDKRRPGLKSALCWLEAKKTEGLKLHDKTALTVLLCKDGKVSASYALVAPNAADEARVVAATAKLLGKEPPQLEVQAEKENVVASKLEGAWQANADLWPRLAGKGAPDKAIISFKSDPKVAAKIPLRYLPFFEGKPVYMSGIMRRDTNEHLFILSTLNGNPHVIYFRPRGGDPLGDAESFNLFIAVAAETANDLLFLGGDFNNQPFYPFERVK
jgi:hypothetical protein